jgi:hypothetical protein
MIGDGNLMGYPVFLHEKVKNPIAKMLASITNDSPWSTKTSKNIILQELDHNLVVICFARLCFHPLRHIINRDENKKITIGARERSHEIDALNIKDFNYKNWVERHHIPSRNAP